MPAPVICPRCGARSAVPVSSPGKQAPCRKCGAPYEPTNGERPPAPRRSRRRVALFAAALLGLLGGVGLVAVLTSTRRGNPADGESIPPPAAQADALPDPEPRLTNTGPLPTDLVERVRAAVVLIRAIPADGPVSNTAGFFAGPDLVIGSVRWDGGRPDDPTTRYEIVLNPGRATARTVRATPVARDRVGQLLALRAEGTELPRPLRVEEAAVAANDPVILFGIEAEAPRATLAGVGVKVSAVSRVAGSLWQVFAGEFPGAVLPGGPAVTPTGAVIGLANPGRFSPITVVSPPRQLAPALRGLIDLPAPKPRVADAEPPGAIPAAVEAATVGLRVVTADGKTVTGTGTLVGPDGLVATDSRVLGFRGYPVGTGAVPTPLSIQVSVGRAGDPTRRLLTGTLATPYPYFERNLALVRVAADDLPPPVDLDPAPRPAKGDPVRVIRFAHDRKTGAELTTAKATVDHITIVGADTAALIWLRGIDLTNSGGLVLDSAGRVIGLLAADPSERRGRTAVPTEVVKALARPDRTGPVPLSVPLPSRVADTCVAANGRYLLLHLPDRRELAVFDPAEKRVVKFIPLPEGEVRIAAGRNKAFVIATEARTVTRYSLTTFAEELTVPVPVRGVVRGTAMGSDSAGPLFVLHEQNTNPLYPIQPALIDPVTLREVEVRVATEGGGVWGLSGGNDPFHVRAGPGGSVFGAWASQGKASLLVRGKAVTAYADVSSPGHLVPGPDDRSLFSQYGIYTSRMGRQGNIGTGRAPTCLPAQTDGFYLTCDWDTRLSHSHPAPGDGLCDLTVRTRPGDRPLITFPDVPLGRNPGIWDKSDLTLDKRVLFASESGRLVVLPKTNDRILVYEVDPYKEAVKAGTGYLVVPGRPPVVIPGKPFDYPLAARSSAGGVTYSLTAGPQGMAVSPDGRLTWAVPDDFDGPATATVAVADSSGAKLLHTFALNPWVLSPPDAPSPSVALPSPTDAVCPAGGGRLLILRLPKDRQLAVLDVAAGKVVKLIPLPEDAALFAAGRDVLIVFAPKANVFERWSLRTLEKELAAKNPFEAPPQVLLMGHDSNGPLFCGPGGFLDPVTLKQVRIRVANAPREPGDPVPEFQVDFGGKQVATRTSADGRVLSWMDLRPYNTNFSTLVIDGTEGRKYDGVSQALPLLGPDGVVYTSYGFSTRDLKDVPAEAAPALTPAPTFRIPAVAGPAYLELGMTGDRFAFNRRGKTDLGVTVRVFGDNRVALPLGAIDGLGFVADRMFLVPQARVLVVIDGAGSVVHLHRFDLREKLDRAGIDYLFVSGSPSGAERGKPFRYAPDVWSRKGGVAIKLVNGPAGMAVAAGSVNWDVPADFKEPAVDVALAVSDSSGRTTTHAFRLLVSDRRTVPDR